MEMIILKKENKIIKIFDTTLRDGEQSPGATMSKEEKIKIAKQLEKLNVDIIEAGFPASNKKDLEAIKEISKIIQNSEICALARCTKNDIDIAWQAIKNAKKPRIHVFIATSDIHLKYKLKMSREEVIKTIKENVTYAKSYCNNIEFSCEDATRTEISFLKEAVETAIDAGATTINIPDSVGYIQPQEYANIISQIKKMPKMKKIDISVHCHDDLGLAVANSLAGVKSGATQIECTVNGIGERAGNAALEEIIMCMKTRNDHYNSTTKINISEIIKTSTMVSDATNIFVQKNKAIVGSNAFAHEAGIHQHGVISNPICYEVVNSQELGINSQLIIGRHSGKHAIQTFLKEKGLNTSEESIKTAMNIVKNLEKNENAEEIIISAFMEK